MKKAFTLLEILIVITIIGTLTSVLILDFAGVKERQELSLMADQTLAMLQQARGEITAGKVRGAVFLCEGAFLKKGEAPLFASADYDAARSTCVNFKTEPYGLSTGGAFLDTISVGGTEVESVWAFYSPPKGTVVFFSDEREVLSGDTVIHFDHVAADPLNLSVEISSVTNLVTLSLGDDE